MNKINWCKGKEKGIKLIEPNDNLSAEYYENAESRRFAERSKRRIRESKAGS